MNQLNLKRLLEVMDKINSEIDTLGRILSKKQLQPKPIPVRVSRRTTSK